MSSQKVSQMKAVFVAFFDTVRMIPEQFRAHPLRLVIKRKDKVIQSEIFGGEGHSSAAIGHLQNFEVTLKPNSSKLGYKPCHLNVRLESVASKDALVDAQINLAQFIKGEGGDVVKMNISGAEPPCVLLLALKGMSAELAAAKEKESRERERVEAIRALEAAKVDGGDEADADAAGDDATGALDAAAVSESVVVAHGLERDDYAKGGGALEEEARIAARSEGPAVEIRSIRAGEFADHSDHEDDNTGETTGAVSAAAADDDASNHGASAVSSPVASPAKADKYAAATSKAARDRQRQDREKRRDERKSRATLARVERERRVEEASLALQQAVATHIQEIRDSVMNQARVDIDGRQCTVPRAAQRIVTTMEEYARHMVTSPVIDREAARRDAQIPESSHSFDSDSDDDTDAQEVARLERVAARPLLPPEAGLQLFVHDLIVMLRWEVSPTPQHHCTLGAWMHTLLLVLNHVLQRFTGSETSALMPQVINARLNSQAVGGGWIDADTLVRDALLAAAGQAKSERAQRRKNRRWWRSLRRPRVFGGKKGGKRRPADSQTDAEEAVLPGTQTIMSLVIPQLPEHAGTERAMGAIVAMSPLFHSIGQRLDTMWTAHEERTVGAARTGKKGDTETHLESERLSSEEAFPILSKLPVNVFSDGQQPAVQRRAAQSPLWDLFREVLVEALPKPGSDAAAFGPFDSPEESPLNDTLKSIGTVLAFELDMALHELLVQCVQLHTDSLPDLAFASLAPMAKKSVEEAAFDSPAGSRYASPERSQSHVMHQAAMHAEQAEEEALAGTVTGSTAAYNWLRSSLAGLYEELVASEVGPEVSGQAPAVDRGYIWNNPLSVNLASDIIRLTLEQLSVLVINENHRRLTVNLAPAPKNKKSKGPQAAFAFTPISDNGCNSAGERVFCSIDDGLHLKQRLDSIEGWLDKLPVQLGQGCRSALLPLRSMCDLLILPPDVFLDEKVRGGALAPLPVPVQRALFAAVRPVTWEHDDDVQAGQDARDTLAQHVLNTPLPDDLAEVAKKDKKNPPPLPMDCEPSAVALPYAMVFRSPERDFSFLDLLTLPSPCYGSVELTHRVLEATTKLLTSRRVNAKNAKVLKQLPPPPPSSLAPTSLCLTQCLDGYYGQLSEAGRAEEEQRAIAVTARWDTTDYRVSIGLSATDELRREEQLLDARRGPDAYVAPDTVLTTIREDWETHGEKRNAREGVRRQLAAVLIPSNKRRQAHH